MKSLKIDREDMLTLTRRMTLKRNSFTRVAGCYVDADGEFDGSFNTNFLKLSSAERSKNLEMAKTVPFADTNTCLRKYEYSSEMQKTGSMWQLLMAMRECGLKNDALMDIFYDKVMESWEQKSFGKAETDGYAIFVYHDRYDIPAKASDKERLGESEEMFEYLIGVICPLIGEYEPGEPEWGFLFPMFTDGGGDLNHVGVYQAEEKTIDVKMLENVLGVSENNLEE